MRLQFASKCLCCCLLLLLAGVARAADVPGLSATESPGVRSVKLADGRYMVPYKVQLTDEISFEMLPIPGGKFKLGSPDTEQGRNFDKKSRVSDEGPQVEVEIEPFWMGKCEVRWAEYKEWMKYVPIFENPDGKRAVQIKDHKDLEKHQVDAVTAPSELYMPEYTFEHGEDPRLPAVTMSQFAARQYTKWLSKKYGQHFRLPNEAEWEYACRAGTTTAYSFGDDPKQLNDYAWTAANSDEKPHFVGTKKPNPWGLHDMHGNVMEWTLDGYDKQGYSHLKKISGPGLALTNWPATMFPRVLRGGSFEFDPELARSAARMGSDELWFDEDPNRPRSAWWLTNDPARAVGMRVIRTLAPPAEADLPRVWETDNEETKHSLKSRLIDGKGSRGVVVPAASKP